MLPLMDNAFALQLRKNLPIYCKICNREMSLITIQHLRTHNITKEDYLIKFNLKKEHLVSEQYKSKLKIAITPERIQQNKNNKKLWYKLHENPMKGKKRPDLSNYNKTRDTSFMHTKEHRNKISIGLTGRIFSKETKAKMSKSMTGHKWTAQSRKNLSKDLIAFGKRKGIKNGRYGKPVSKESREKSRKTHIANFKKQVAIKGHIISEKFNKEIPYRSNLEVIFIQFCEKSSLIKELFYENLSILYFFEKTWHRTIPDFEIIDCFDRKYIIEIKGSHLLKLPKEQAKIIAVTDYCKKTGIIYKVLTEKELKNENQIEEIFRKKIDLRFTECNSQ